MRSNAEAKRLERVGISPVEQRAISKRLEKKRLAFGKSSIHGWGLFSKEPIFQNELITEYCGEMIRASVANLREAKYQRSGEDCYLFKISDGCVIDATRKGCISRLINHSCDPNTYAKIVELNGVSHILFYALRDMEAYEVLNA